VPTIFFYGPKLELGKKKELIRAFTKAASAATGTIGSKVSSATRYTVYSGCCGGYRKGAALPHTQPEASAPATAITRQRVAPRDSAACRV